MRRAQGGRSTGVDGAMTSEPSMVLVESDQISSLLGHLRRGSVAIGVAITAISCKVDDASRRKEREQ